MILHSFWRAVWFLSTSPTAVAVNYMLEVGTTHSYVGQHEIHCIGATT